METIRLDKEKSREILKTSSLTKETKLSTDALHDHLSNPTQLHSFQ